MLYLLHKAYDAYKAYKGYVTPEASKLLEISVNVWSTAKNTIKSLKAVRKRLRVVVEHDPLWVSSVFRTLDEQELASYLSYEKWRNQVGRPKVKESSDVYNAYTAEETFEWQNWYADLELRYLVFVKDATPVIVIRQDCYVDYIAKFPVEPICIVKDGVMTDIQKRRDIIRHWLDGSESWIPDMVENLNDYSDIPAKAAVLGYDFAIPGTHTSADGNLELADKFFYGSSSRAYANNEFSNAEEEYLRCLGKACGFYKESVGYFKGHTKEEWEAWYAINEPTDEISYIDWFKRKGDHEKSDEIVNAPWHDNNEKHLSRVGYQNEDDYAFTALQAVGIRKTYTYIKSLGVIQARKLGLVNPLAKRCKCGNIIKMETSATPDIFFCPYCGREHQTAYKPAEESYDALAYKLEHNGYDVSFHDEDPEYTDWELDDLAVDDIKSERQSNNLYCKSPEYLVLNGLVDEDRKYREDLIKLYNEVRCMTEFGRKTFLADKGNRYAYSKAEKLMEELFK